MYRLLLVYLKIGYKGEGEIKEYILKNKNKMRWVPCENNQKIIPLKEVAAVEDAAWQIFQDVCKYRAQKDLFTSIYIVPNEALLSIKR